MKLREAIYEPIGLEAIDRSFELVLQGIHQATAQRLKVSLTETEREREPVIWQRRIGGPNGGTFMMAKLQTYNEEGEIYNPTAARIRAYGGDEAAQYLNMRCRQMRACGFRAVQIKSVGSGPLDALGMDEIMDCGGKQARIWRKMTKTHLPGVVSPYGIFEHKNKTLLSRQELIEARVHMEPEFVESESTSAWLSVFREYMAAARNRELEQRLPVEMEVEIVEAIV